jgi:hypothetical protein
MQAEREKGACLIDWLISSAVQLQGRSHAHLGRDGCGGTWAGYSRGAPCYQLRLA